MLPVLEYDRKNMGTMLPKYPCERMVIEGLGCLDGLQLLDLFKSKASHALTQKEALHIWEYLRRYLWDEEEVILYVAWEHFRFGRGKAELTECIAAIKKRMEGGRY
ncbi:MAG: hypothetical protein ACTSRU_01005 [Candidatus Hodarchaeales archaeon]